ncbi:uncharacterized protein LOC123318421 [Coccinella septempunctata]|uniref:uncharacterized protein LOC123318421 n=1 Tax=Coccinella septempunctata TaxID=41139 RepID=UPI001D06F389|nr:uncharacterized protein LOC123318421 [Coccinella septempunctata]
MEKIMSKEFSGSKENIENIYEDFIDACRGKLETPLLNLNKSMEEFAFKDEVERKIKRLHREIGEAVFDLAYDIKKLNGKIKSWYITSYKKENLGSYDFLFSFSRCFKEILSDIHEMRQKLHYDDSLAPSERLLKQKLEISQISLTSGVVTKGKKNHVDEGAGNAKKFERRRSMRTTSPLIKTKNYVFLLYPSTPQDDRSFFSIVHHKTYTSYCDIQESAKVFYETHGEILDSSRIPSDYKAFVEEILMKYKYFQLQLEFAWLDNAIEFYDILSYFYRFLGNYYFDTLKKYFESRNEKLMEKCSELSRILEVNMKAVEEHYVSIHNKLKPMFGHPEKARMLAIVETFIDQAMDFNNKILLDPLEPSKESIKEHCIKTETIFLDMERILSCIKCSTTLVILFKELEDKMLERIDILQRILTPDSSSLDVANQTDFDVDLRQRLQDYKSKASIPTDCVITYTSITQSITSIESVTPLDFEKIIRSNFNEYEKMADKIEMVKTKCSSVHEKYRTMWEQDIQRILNLYRVKYDAAVPD